MNTPKTPETPELGTTTLKAHGAKAVTPETPKFRAEQANVDLVRVETPKSAASDSSNDYVTPSSSHGSGSWLLTNVKNPVRGQPQGEIESPNYPGEESSSISSIKDASPSFSPGSPGGSFSGSSSTSSDSTVTKYDPIRPRQTDISKDELSTSITSDIISRIRLNTTGAVDILNENVKMLEEIEKRSSSGGSRKKKQAKPHQSKKRKNKSRRTPKNTPRM